MSARAAVSQPLARLKAFADRHGQAFWWIHSLYALGLGIGFMWLGARDFLWLRVAAFYIVFLWVSSTIGARVFDEGARAASWSRRARLVVNYVNRNAYQQVLFFILPLYYASTTWRSVNVVFLVFLAVSAVLSTLDVVYDRFLTINRWRAAGFFAFNAFATVHVALPVLFGVANHVALRLATVAATAGFATIAFRPGQLHHLRTWGFIAAGAAAVFGLAEAARPLVPPAPLRLAHTEFGRRMDVPGLRVLHPQAVVVPSPPGRLFAVASVDAPAGLRDRLVLRWSQESAFVRDSPPYSIQGGRAAGFRLWTSIPLDSLDPSRPVALEVLTEAGQLVGLARLPAGLAER